MKLSVRQRAMVMGPAIAAGILAMWLSTDAITHRELLYGAFGSAILYCVAAAVLCVVAVLVQAVGVSWLSERPVRLSGMLSTTMVAFGALVVTLPALLFVPPQAIVLIPLVACIVIVRRSESLVRPE